MSLRHFIASRKLFKPLNLLKETAILGWNEVANLFDLNKDVFYNPKHKKIERPVTAILIGAGHRGSIYASYGNLYPNELKIVAVADITRESSVNLRSSVFFHY